MQSSTFSGRRDFLSLRRLRTVSSASRAIATGAIVVHSLSVVQSTLTLACGVKKNLSYFAGNEQGRQTMIRSVVSDNKVALTQLQNMISAEPGSQVGIQPCPA